MYLFRFFKNEFKRRALSSFEREVFNVSKRNKFFMIIYVNLQMIPKKWYQILYIEGIN